VSLLLKVLPILLSHYLSDGWAGTLGLASPWDLRGHTSLVAVSSAPTSQLSRAAGLLPPGLMGQVHLQPHEFSSILPSKHLLT
jgi:hypothetical protein